MTTSSSQNATQDDTYYDLYIDCVDGSTTYNIGTLDKLQAMKFLAKYDHEGSSIALKLRGAEQIEADELYNEEVYNFLAE